MCYLIDHISVVEKLTNLLFIFCVYVSLCFRLFVFWSKCYVFLYATIFFSKLDNIPFAGWFVRQEHGAEVQSRGAGAALPGAPRGAHEAGWGERRGRFPTLFLLFFASSCRITSDTQHRLYPHHSLHSGYAKEILASTWYVTEFTRITIGYIINITKSLSTASA